MIFLFLLLLLLLLLFFFLFIYLHELFGLLKEPFLIEGEFSFVLNHLYIASLKLTRIFRAKNFFSALFYF
jgi:hypothetical protein